MPIKISVLKETRLDERRVALVPGVADKLVKLGAVISMQSGAGDAANLPDKAFKNVAFVSDARCLVSDADIVLAVQPPAPETVRAMKGGAILLSFVYANKEPALVDPLRQRTSPVSRWSACRASVGPRRWMRCRARLRSRAIMRRSWGRPTWRASFPA